MFFDSVQTDEQYRNLLITFAKKQKEILMCRFNPETRCEIIGEKTGFFKKRDVLGERISSLGAQLENIKRSIISHRHMQGYPGGTFWWTLPRDMVEDYLLYDLCQEQDYGNRRYEHTWHTEQLENGFSLLILDEEGHISDFSASNSYSRVKESKYSASEQAQMKRDFNNRLNLYALADLSLGEARVHSVLSGADYDSKADYYSSSEYWAMRMYASDRYERSLYTLHETDSVQISSNSRHYKCSYAVAAYHADNVGTLDFVKLFNYKCIAVTGDADDDIINKYSSFDSAVACAFHLSSVPAVKSVPLSLFGKDIETGSVDYDEAIRQAEIYACIAEKITI